MFAHELTFTYDPTRNGIECIKYFERHFETMSLHCHTFQTVVKELCRRFDDFPGDHITFAQFSDQLEEDLQRLQFLTGVLMQHSCFVIGQEESMRDSNIFFRIEEDNEILHHGRGPKHCKIDRDLLHPQMPFSSFASYLSFHTFDRYEKENFNEV